MLYDYVLRTMPALFFGSHSTSSRIGACSLLYRNTDMREFLYVTCALLIKLIVLMIFCYFFQISYFEFLLLFLYLKEIFCTLNVIRVRTCGMTCLIGAVFRSDVWKTPIDARNNWWGFNTTVAVSGRIHEKLDDITLLSVDYS